MRHLLFLAYTVPLLDLMRVIFCSWHDCDDFKILGSEKFKRIERASFAIDEMCVVADVIEKQTLKIGIRENQTERLTKEHAEMLAKIRPPVFFLPLNGTAYINKIFLDENEQTVHISGSVQLYWNDERYSWNRTELTWLTVNHIWKPNIIGKEVQNQATFVRGDGDVMSHWTFKNQYECSLDTYNFPFDTNRCCLIFQIADDFRIMKSNFQAVFSKSYIQNLAWTAKRSHFDAAEKYSTYDGETTNDFDLCLDFRRNSAIFVSECITTAVLLVFLSIMILFWTTSLERQFYLKCLAFSLKIFVFCSLPVEVKRGSSSTPRIVLLYETILCISLISMVLSLLMINISSETFRDQSSILHKFTTCFKVINKFGSYFSLKRIIDRDDGNISMNQLDEQSSNIGNGFTTDNSTADLTKAFSAINFVLALLFAFIYLLALLILMPKP